MQRTLSKYRISLTGKRAIKGSTTVMALMVSMFLILLVFATTTLTVADVQRLQDYGRNKKTFQAADSGLEHGKLTINNALSTLNLPAKTTPKDVNVYANQAESGGSSGNVDISLLVDSGSDKMGGNIDEILQRNTVKTSGYTEYTDDDQSVGYDVSYDLTPTEVIRPEEGDITYRHTFKYDYSISSQGRSRQLGHTNTATRVLDGEFEADVLRPSFSTYAYFTQGMKNQFGDQLVFYDGEVYDGPVHVNSGPPEGRAGFYGSPVFNGPFTAVQDSYADSWLGGNAEPQFNGGVTWGVDEITLPENAWSQLRAAVGDYDSIDTPAPPTIGQLRVLLGLPGSADPTDPKLDEGVYVSSGYNTGDTLLGGIFINGNPEEIQFAELDGVQIIKITMTPSDGGYFDKGNKRTWTIKDNLNTGTTTLIVDGAATEIFTGNINGVIHTEGTVQSVIGKNDGTAKDIEANHQLTLSATGDIYIADHITYQDDPKLNPDAKNVFGMFSSNGNVMVAENAPSNLTIDATIMATSTNHGIGAEGLVVNGAYDYNYPYKGNLNLYGGLIEYQNQTTGVYYSDGHRTGYNWDFEYDPRFLEGVAPPYFPYVTKFIIQMGAVELSQWGRKYY